MTYAIKHLFHINTSKEKIFEAISTINGLSNWWTTKTSGNAAVGEIINFSFGDGMVEVREIQELKMWEMLE